MKVITQAFFAFTLTNFVVGNAINDNTTTAGN